MQLKDNIATSLHLPNIYEGAEETVATTPLFGIELEFENAKMGIVMPSICWDTTGDPSLRNNGIEFVSMPLPLDCVREELRGLQNSIKTAGLDATKRCGVHVHLNWRPYTWGQLFSFYCLYTLLEPTIFARYAPDRIDNHFCVPAFSNTALCKLIETDTALIRANNVPDISNGKVDMFGRNRSTTGLKMSECPKYSAVNFKRLFDLGTLEFRHLAATKDMIRVGNWVHFLATLQKEGVTWDDPTALINEYYEHGLNPLLTRVNLKREPVDHIDQEEAEDTAILMAGVNMPDWQELDWTMEDIECAE